MPTIPRLTFHSDAQLASHMAAMNSADSPSIITVISFCSTARVRPRRLSLSASSLIRQIYHLLSLLPSCSSAEFSEPRALCFRQHSDTRLAAALPQSAEITGAQPLLRRARRLAISHLCQIAATNTREPVAQFDHGGRIFYQQQFRAERA